MTPKAIVWTAALTGAAAAAAMALPWAHYGGISIALNRLPGWGYYIAAALALNLIVGWSMWRRPHDRRLLLVAGGALCATTIGTATTVMLRYDEPAAIFDGIVPLVAPGLGLGGPVAIVAACVSGTALVVHTTSAPTPPSPTSARRHSRRP